MKLTEGLNPDLASKLNIIEQEARKIWAKGELNHLYYTLHGLDHSKSVINILENLIVGLKPESKLSQIEIFCLVSAAYLHDIGMQIKYSDDEDRARMISKSKRKNYTIQDLIRDEHHKRSGTYIKENSKNLKLDNFEAEVIRLISEGHRKVDLKSNGYDDQVIGNDLIRVRLLSALLRLSDELDITYKRAPDSLFEILKIDMPEYSILQWLKHHYTSGLLVSTAGNITTVDVRCHYPNETNGNKIVEDIIIEPIKQRINEVQVILLKHGLDINLTYKLYVNPDLEEIPEHICEQYLQSPIKNRRELPKTKGFVGRDKELQQLSSSLKKNIIVIEGIAGIGKTYVAVKFAEKLESEYHIYWHENLSEVSTLSSVLNKLATFLKDTGKPRMFNSLENFGYDNDVLISLLKEELNSNNIAIFFDDYHKAEKELDPLLNQLKEIDNSKIILITRKEPNFYNILDEKNNKVSLIKIDSWDLNNTQMMLAERSLFPSSDALIKIHERLHGHPQYLNLFCILAINEDAETLLEKIPLALKDAHEYLEKEVYNSLTSQEKLLLQTISVFRIAETADAFDNINEFSNLSETLDSLTYKFLVDEIGIDKFKVHDIIRDFCLSDVRKAKILKKYHSKAAEYYLLDTDNLESILESVYHYKEAEQNEQSAEVLVTYASDFISKGFWQKVEFQLKESIKMFRRKTQPNLIHLSAWANYAVAELYGKKGNYDEAFKYVNASVYSFKKYGVQENLLNPYTLLAAIYHERENQELVEEYLLKCENIVKASHDKKMEMVYKANCLQFLNKLNNNEKLKSYFEVLEFFESDGDEIKIASAAASISHLYAKNGDFKKSLFYAKKALDIYQQRNDLFDIARIKFSIVQAFIQYQDEITDLDKLFNCLDQVLETYIQIGHVRGEVGVRILKGELFTLANDFDLAIESYQHILRIYSSLNEKDTVMNPLFNIGICLTKAKRYDKAISHFSEMLKNEDLTCEEILCTKCSLIEVQILNCDYDPASILSLELIDESKSADSIKFFSLGNLFASISFLYLGNLTAVCYHLKSINDLKSTKITVDWNFSDIEPSLNKLEYKNQYLDMISYLKGETNYPIIRLDEVQIVSEKTNESGELFHPFVGSLEIKKDDSDLKSILTNLSNVVEIDQDASNIMGINREKALLILGFLLKKEILECKPITNHTFELRLTSKGSKIKF